MDGPHLRIAITTDSLTNLDAPFVAAKNFVVYDVSADESEFIDALQFVRRAKGKAAGGGREANGGRCVMEDMENDDGTGHDPLTERVDALDGVSILFTMGLSDLAAVRVQQLKVFPVKSERHRAIDDVIAQVQAMLAGVQPLWMRRAIARRTGAELAEQYAY
ncbi:nitrogen fixation protein NifX [Rhodoblastus acidophilus]|uniref:NifB/NifX family molybdenum-iron cluster-binding protein n=1 Tax=Rhodoblastus acidophilus TaxID=1074 RepID=UPI0022242698|nr:NifB/NifX family molybdenum-iron cluster-binding protein [Rhodoblastus acidophilus]MCW2317506.1 nitrogen fixation protein NifX [Rhodoblastus acidophilus]